MSAREHKRCHNPAAAAILTVAGAALTAQASAHGGGGAGEQGSATHQHLDPGFSHDRYYYDRGYAVHKPPAGGLADLNGSHGEHYYFQGGNWFLWRGDWYRDWGGAWIVVDAPVGLLLPALPPHATPVWWNGTQYYYANDTYYLWNAARREYEVVSPPPALKAAS